MTPPITSNETKVNPFKKAFTEPLKPQKGPVKFSVSNSFKAGYTQYGGDQVSLLGFNPEAKVEYKGWYAGAEIAAGTAVSGKVELGKEIEFNKNWGMDVSAYASHDLNFMRGRNLTISGGNVVLNLAVDGERYRNDINLNDININLNSQGVVRTGLKAMGKYTTNDGKFTIGAGLSGQYAMNNSKDVLVKGTTIHTGTIEVMGKEYKVDNITIPDQQINLHKQGFVLSPEVSAEYRFNDRIALEANGNFFGGEIKVKHNLK